MSKAVKKKSRKLWRTVRKTLGTLFLVSALVVAAIPVDYLQAEGEAADVSGMADDAADTGTTVVTPPHTDRSEMKVSIASIDETTYPSTWKKTDIPDVTTADYNYGKIYKSENLNFSFVIKDIRGDVPTAVIVGYDNMNQQNNVGDVLTIPRKVDAYAPYRGIVSTDPQPSLGQSCALGGENGEFLFYRIPKAGTGSGNSSPEYEYQPCFYLDYNEWKDLEWESGEGGNDNCLYYMEGLTPDNLEEALTSPELGYKFSQGIPEETDAHKWKPANGRQVQRIKGIDVSFIGMQYVDDNGFFHTIQHPSEGIFTTATVGTLVVEPNLEGIGSYAFAGTNIKSVALSNTVTEIGNGAFQGCTSLESFSIGSDAVEVVIGDHAFFNCSELTQFDACKVTKIGDSAFERCGKLSKFNLLGAGTSGKLETMGYYAFAYCGALGELIFPDTYSENDILASTFLGCSGLYHIYATGKTTPMNFMGDSFYPLSDFRGGVDSTFYFEGPKGSALEKTAIDNYFVFKYADEEVYEKKVPDKASDSYPNGPCEQNVIYEVERIVTETGQMTNTGRITNIVMEGGLRNLDIVGRNEKIGPLDVTEIAEDAFRNNTDLVNVTIPDTIAVIGARAFMGCYNLKNVTFTGEPTESNMDIKADAFKTQEGNTSAAEPVLNFIGPISKDTDKYAPFEYAMTQGNDISFGNQPQNIYIKYYSGWPYNLMVQYNPATGMNTLMEYPTLTNLLKGMIVPIKDQETGSITSCTVHDNKYNSDDYYYMTNERQLAAINVAKKSLGIWNAEIDKINDEDTEELSRLESELSPYVMNITLPAGIQAVREGLFREEEAKEKETIESKRDEEGNLPKAPVKSLTTRGLVDVSNNAFEGAEYFNTVSLEGGIKSVGSNAFKDCSNLALINIKGEADSIGDYAFKDCKSLVSATLDGVTEIGSYAFEGCENLSAVSVSSRTKTINTAPFLGCGKLATVSFPGSNDFAFENSIIYQLKDGKKSVIIEYLKGGTTPFIQDDAVKDIDEVKEEAFRDTKVSMVNFTGARFKTLPKGAFQDTIPGLLEVTLPDSCDYIDPDAFLLSAFLDSSDASLDNWIVQLEIPNENLELNLGQFCSESEADAKKILEHIVINSVEGKQPERFAKSWARGWNRIAEKYTVTSWAYATGKTETSKPLITWRVEKEDEVPIARLVGELEVALKDPAREDVKFDDYPGHEWNSGDWRYTYFDNEQGTWVELEDGVTIVDRPLRIEAKYTPIVYKVDFYDKDDKGGKLLTTKNPNWGDSVDPPVIYDDEGESIRGVTWKDLDDIEAEPLTSQQLSALRITKDMRFQAKYDSSNGTNQGGNNQGGNNQGGDNQGGNNQGGNSGNQSGTKEGQHKLEVLNGLGSGNYAKDEQIIITANAPAEGMEFSEWDISPAETVVTDKTRSVTIITMPDKDVAAVAVYKPKGTGDNSQNSNYHSLLVHNGSGSGSYVAGAQIIITANEPGRGQSFSGWTVSPADTVVTDKTLASAVITMPDHDVAVIANYKGGTTSTTVGGTTGSGNTSSGTGTGTRPNNTSGSRGGTTVVIDKNGLSNTGVVSATVNGSSDNFTVKITESSAAAEAALKALQAEYGSLDNIKYFPMDISLYDSTGNTKITDTTGLSVSITLPLPDSLIPYAGNNKVAGVVNDRLDKLTPRFTTINGVACVTFTAEHFSPYLIYVDLTNLSDGTVSDSTPTTGDGIHPKWFLSIGLACLSFVMFMVKDGGSSKKKRKVAVRARN